MDNRNNQLLDDFFSGALTADQQQQFEELLKTDEDFRKEYDLRSGIAKVFTRLRHKELKSRFSALAEAERNGSVSYPSFTLGKSIGYLTAALVVLAAGLSWVWFTHSQPSTDTLYTAYFSNYPNVILPVERSNSQPDDRSRAYALYEGQQFKQAYELLTGVDKRADPEARFYAALSAMQLGLMNEAVALLEDYLHDANQKLERQAIWYLALARLKKEELDSARQLLQQLFDSPGYKNTEAGDLLKKLA